MNVEKSIRQIFENFSWFTRRTVLTGFSSEVGTANLQIQLKIRLTVSILWKKHFPSKMVRFTEIRQLVSCFPTSDCWPVVKLFLFWAIKERSSRRIWIFSAILSRLCWSPDKSENLRKLQNPTENLVKCTYFWQPLRRVQFKARGARIKHYQQAVFYEEILMPSRHSFGHAIRMSVSRKSPRIAYS